MKYVKPTEGLDRMIQKAVEGRLLPRIYEGVMPDGKRCGPFFDRELALKRIPEGSRLEGRDQCNAH